MPYSTACHSLGNSIFLWRWRTFSVMSDRWVWISRIFVKANLVAHISGPSTSTAETGESWEDGGPGGCSSAETVFRQVDGQGWHQKLSLSTCMHVSTCIRTHANTRASTHVCAGMYLQAHTHTDTHTWMNTCRLKYTCKNSQNQRSKKNIVGHFLSYCFLTGGGEEERERKYKVGWVGR